MANKKYAIVFHDGNLAVIRVSDNTILHRTNSMQDALQFVARLLQDLQSV